MTIHRTCLLTIVLTLTLAGCGDTSDDLTVIESPTVPEKTDVPIAPAYTAECGDAFADAAAVDAMQDTNEDLYPAVIACQDLAAFADAAEDHPGALDGVDPETWLDNICQSADDPDVTGSALCSEVTG
ncbi:MAG: hypothetical protein KY469_10520 [Actinobacteria bacterium]|nr:hypothetical protein [Actinomycetota bacterium]